MRTLISLSLLAVGLAGPPTVWAQEPPPIRFDNIQVGFAAVPDPEEPADERGRLAFQKAGAWTPVYVSFTTGNEEIRTGKIVVEATDSDDVQNAYTVPLPPGGLRPNEPYTFLAYTKPGSSHGELTITVHADDRTFEAKKVSDSLGTGDVLLLTVGSRLPGLRQTLVPLNARSSRAAQTRAAYVDTDVRALPDRWYGYAAVDLLILSTGNGEFITELINETGHRKEALAEWVRRGGRMVISLGRNQDMVPVLLRRMQMDLPVRFAGPLALRNAEALQAWLPPGLPPLSQPGGRAVRPGQGVTVDSAKLERKPGGILDTIVPFREGDGTPPVIVRAPYGLGQVTLVAFDLDRKPFTDWAGQPEFWRKLLERLRARPFEPAQPADSPGRYNPNQFGAELAGALERNLENFPDIPVISFGWVALFILVYILLVGPVDYLFLKKVVKRLEFTWITFPTIVLAVSAVAYFAAYAIKGNDLKINKVDVVDVDLTTQRAYGNTWFTLFSPRIQLYTVGVEPNLPAGPDSVGQGPGSVLVSWMGRPEVGYGGYGRARSQSLFRRAYEFEPDAAGLRGVPIQVWSTKSFAAAWERPLDPRQPPFRVEVRLGRSVPVLEGTLTNQLPAALHDAVLIHSEGRMDSNVKAYPLGVLRPGQPVRIKSGGAAPALGQWLAEGGATAMGAVSVPGVEIPMPNLVRRLMFHGASVQEAWGNSSLQHLDQSWRRTHQNEAILVARLEGQNGPAEAVNASPDAPSRLWLGAVPGAGAARPTLQGTMTQQTYLRIWIPLTGPAAEGRAEDRNPRAPARTRDREP